MNKTSALQISAVENMRQHRGINNSFEVLFVFVLLITTEDVALRIQDPAGIKPYSLCCLR